MSMYSIWYRCAIRGRFAGVVAVCLVVLLGLTPVRVLGQEVAAAGEELRALVARDGWVRIQVALRKPAQSSSTVVAIAALRQQDLDQTAGDLLFALPPGSYDSLLHVPGAPDLSLRVDAAGLDVLLASPLVETVTLAANSEMQRIAAGAEHSLAIRDDGSLWAWGSNVHGQLGDGTTTERDIPVQIMNGVVAVSAHYLQSLALDGNGTLWAWGFNSKGQLGDGTTTERHSPVPVLTGVAAVASSHWHGLAIKTDGGLWAWGDNEWGQLGDGTTTKRLSPIKVMTGVAAVAAGYGHSLAIRADGSLWAWGYDNDGEVGDGTVKLRHPKPVKVMTGVTAVGAGDFHSLAVKINGSLWVWGFNRNGQLGDGTTTKRATPFQIMSSGMATATGGAAYSLGLKIDTTLLSWGYNETCELGDGTCPTEHHTPGQVPLMVVVAMVGGNGHALARTFDGTLWGWGSNKSGQVGDGASNASNANRKLPVKVAFSLPPLLPDFVITGIVLTPARPTVNGTFSATITVRNQGLGAGLPGVLQVWANQSADQDCGATGDRSMILTTGLAPWASQVVTVTGLRAGAAGDRTLHAFIDSACRFTETDETNNQNTLVYTVIPPAPDFVVTGLVPIPPSPLAGGTFSARMTVKNQGTAPGVPGSLQVWADQPNVQACGARGDKSVNVPARLAVGASAPVTLAGLPVGAVGANHTLRAFIDSACASAESEDTNNQATTSYGVVAPDFVVTAITLTPTSLRAGRTFKASITVKNEGTAAGVPGRLQVWADQPASQNCAAVGNKSVTLTSLAAGTSRTVSVTGLSAGVAGDKKLRTFIDSRCAVAEADEGNNQTELTYTVAP